MDEVVMGPQPCLVARCDATVKWVAKSLFDPRVLVLRATTKRTIGTDFLQCARGHWYWREPPARRLAPFTHWQFDGKEIRQIAREDFVRLHRGAPGLVYRPWQMRT